ncbi:MAG TPA: type II toxin-antitoxin system RelE/ParE family toxin [Anaerolineales bacterium]|nr:type II toxin-antitoxin system RelE/ParE family toxin [Anaerolineales bacterium]
MEIVETSVFTRQVLALLADDEYRTIQAALANRPTLGPVIPGSGGVRKVRWGLSGRGKRGGVRVIYYWAATKDVLLMLLIYAKSEQEDLSPSQLKALRGIVKDEYR